MGFFIFLASVVLATGIGAWADLNPLFRLALILLAVVLSLGASLALEKRAPRPKDHDTS